MNKVLSLLLLCFLFLTEAVAQNVVLTGVYKGNDLYVKNPFSDDGIGFCAYEIHVNGDVTSDEVNSSAFLIDLAALALEPQEKLFIEIYCKSKCGVEVINPEAIAPESTFDIVSMSIDETGKLQWETNGETGNIPFALEQFKWNKWVEVAKIHGSGNGRRNSYSYAVPLHQGKNTFRLKQKSRNGVHYSDTISVVAESKEPVKLKHSRIMEKVEFTEETFFELYSELGELLTSGYGSHFSVGHLPRGTYYLNYGNRFGETIVKR